MRFLMPDHVIDLNSIDKLAYVRDLGDRIAIGSMTRQRDIELSPVIGKRLTLLAEALRFTGQRGRNSMTRMHPVSVTVNGRKHDLEVEGRRILADMLRHRLHLTGTHLGCGHGVCGACTVLVDGRSVRSCLMLAVQADGKSLETVEGPAAADDTLHPVQDAFIGHHGLQCGFCTPGMLMTLVELLRTTTDLTEPAVREAIAGNLCRCTGYQGIVDAALSAAGTMGSQKRALGE